MFAKAILVGAFAAIAAAQSTVLTFTNVANPITDGQPTALLWATNDTVSPVTILLRKGLATNLETVEVITTTGRGNQYIWTPCSSLENGNDYALQILQAGQLNYFGPFTIQGATGSGSCSGLVSTATATSSANSTSSTLTPVVGGSNSTSAVNGTSQSNSTATTSSPLITPTPAAHNNGTLRDNSTTTANRPTTSNTGAAFTTSSTSTAPNAGPTAAIVGGGSIAVLLGAVAAMVMV